MFAGNGSSGEDEKERSASISKLFPASSVPVYRALKDDAARGGCLLSAGELDSSKEYLEQPDGSWVVAYQVPSLPPPASPAFLTHSLIYI